MIFFKKLKFRKVVGKSMWPVVADGAICIFGSKKNYKQNDIVLIEHQGKEYLKKIDQIEHTKVRVISNDYFGLDSRVWGPLDRQVIQAKLLFKIPKI